MDNQRHADCKNCKRQDVGPKHFCHDRLLFHGVFGITEVNQHNAASSLVKCALCDRNGGIFKETPEGSLS